MPFTNNPLALADDRAEEEDEEDFVLKSARLN
jgi:hypothetical protein